MLEEHPNIFHKTNTGSAFITLTYAPEHLPSGGGLVHKHFQQFMKELRRDIAPHRVRFLMCGEYGEKLQRPHYHACIFGWDFPDQYLCGRKNGQDLYRSPQLERLWRRGISTVGSVTFQSAGYVARYIFKKKIGNDSEFHYINQDTGEILPTEYVKASNRPGLGYYWFQKYGMTDCFPHDRIVWGGNEYRVPRYYDKLLEEADPDLFATVKAKRVERAKQQDPEEQHSTRRAAKARHKELIIDRHLPREFYEIDDVVVST